MSYEDHKGETSFKISHQIMKTIKISIDRKSQEHANGFLLIKW